MDNDKSSLPKWAERFLSAICPEPLYEEIEGDLIEAFNRKKKERGETRANWFLFVNTFKYFRPGILLRNRVRPSANFAIVRNYLLTSYRHVLKDKLNSSFKLTGLTLSLFGLLVVALYVSYQLSFDRYNNDYERIYRVNTQRLENGNVEQYGIAPVAFGHMLMDEFPEVEVSARFDIANGSHIKYKEKVIWGGVFGVDSTWFDIFSYKFIKGTRDALTRPSTIVLTETLALKLFGNDDPMHKLLTINNGEKLFEVTAVIQDIPQNSHIRGEAFVGIDRTQNFSAQHIISPPEFVDNSTVLFIKLRTGADPDVFVFHLERTLDKFVPRKKRNELGFRIFLQPLKDIYLDPPLKYEFTRKGSMVYLYVFTVLGIFLLVISCINYANLSLAGFMNRSREIGVRKVLGGKKQQVIVQVALDTSAYCLIAFAGSILLLYILFPYVQEYIEPNLSFDSLTSGVFLLFMAGIVLIIIFLSTVIPAGWFSANSVTNDLKGIISSGGKMKFNNALLLAQFVISVICIGATLTIGQQIDFIHNKDLGINRKNLLVLTMSEDFTVEKMKAFKASLKTIPGVVNASNSSFRMGGGFWKDWYSVEVGNEMKSFELYEVFSDDELFETLEMKVLQGRVFDAEHKADSGAAFVVNETAVHELGLTKPIGTRILTHPEEPGKWDGTIVGVVNDINISTLHHKVKPLVMRLPWQNSYPEYFVYARIDGDVKVIIEAIKAKYNLLQPGYPLEVHFVDDFYNKEYAKENRAYASLKFGTAVIIIVSSLGIFSLSIYLSVRKMKEFGIRKVLGATAEQITYLHVWHFLRIAAGGALLALPLTFLLMNEWLASFAYRVDVGVETAFAVLALTMLLIIISSSYAAIRAGKTNPVNIINRV
ncbi:MAG TPA: FtsX-like permease family protein [Chryseosolibacter sp.]